MQEYLWNILVMYVFNSESEGGVNKSLIYVCKPIFKSIHALLSINSNIVCLYMLIC